MINLFYIENNSSLEKARFDQNFNQNEFFLFAAKSAFTGFF
jgi:hypothetical protein